MAAPNEVRVNIRHNILLLKTFTVPELRDVTGLNRQSIYTEVRRLAKRGYVSEVGTRQREKGSAGGRPPKVYRLTSDPERRFELLQSVRAFYIPAGEQPVDPLRPESKHYFIAQEILKDTEDREADLTWEERTERAALISKRLEYARQEEDIGERGTELVAASLDILEAKAIDTLLGNWNTAIKLLDEARRACAQFAAEDLVADIDSYVHTIVARMTDKQRRLVENGKYEEAEMVLQNLLIIEDRFDDLTGIHSHVESAKMIASLARRALMSAQFEERALHFVANAWKEQRRMLIDQREPIERHIYFVVQPSARLSSLASRRFESEAVSAYALLGKRVLDEIEQTEQPDDWLKRLLAPGQLQEGKKLEK